jgi:hypothetical protein
MAYNKDSGESRLQKNVYQDNYNQKKNKNIFKNSQIPQTSSQPQHKPNYEGKMPDINVLPEMRLNERKIPKSDKEEHRGSYEYERRRKENANSQQESQSFLDVIGIIVANGLVPIIGGMIVYNILSARGKKVRAAQSILLSTIVSIIRIIHLILTK